MTDWSSLPTDLNELYGDLHAADQSGNQEAAAIIAKRINMVKRANAGGYDPMKDESGLSKFMIGMGRGFMDLGQGAKQKALMAGEGLGLVEEGRAQEYSDEVSDEIKRFESDFEGIGAESFGRFGGWAAGGAPLAGASLPAAVAAGVLEGGIMPTESAEWDETVKNAALGGLTAGALKGGQYALQTPSARNITKGVRNKAEEMLGRNKPVASLQDEFIEGVNQAKKSESVQWDILSNRVGDELVDDVPLYEGLLREVEKLQKSGGGADSIKKIEALWDDMPRSEDGLVSFNALKEFRSNFAGANKNSFMNEGMPEAIVNRIYSDITDQMETVVRGEDKRFWDLAMDATVNRKNLVKQSKARPDLYRGKTPVRNEDWFRRALLGSNEDQVDAITKLMTSEGREGAKAFLMQNIAGEVLESTGAGASKRFGKLSNTVDRLFDPDEAAEIRGFIEFLDTAKTEKSLESLMKNVRSVGTAVGGAKAAIGSVLLPSLMRSKETKALLRKLATTEKGSKIRMQLIDRLTGIFTQGTVAAQTQDDPYTVSIRNGVTQ